ncbi:MAG: hypothetical protein JO282_13685 [Alphaproteobacteria bacterium]|nr:hypothetical protein [Alphaproteobacteria bacterium]
MPAFAGTLRIVGSSVLMTPSPQTGAGRRALPRKRLEGFSTASCNAPVSPSPLRCW